MTSYKNLEEKIHETVELSSICRGEWCRSLESKMDVLVDEMHEYLRTCKCDERYRGSGIEREIRDGYRNLGPDIHV